MADVKTESLKILDTNTKPTFSTNSSDKMTVDKQPGQPSASKNKTTVKESSHEAPSISPTQLKVASGNNAPASPKKPDSKNSPTSRVPPTGVQPRTQVQQHGKSKVNPWHKNSSPTTGTVPKKGPGLAPEGGDKSGSGLGSSPPKEDLNSSKSIRIPKEEVWVIVCGSK